MCYVIITPAYNEAEFVEKVAESVLRQSVTPLRWVVVDDGSTDATASIIKRYASEHAFIQYHHRAKPLGQAYFASNVYAIMEGYDLLRHMDYEYVAILDSDITLPHDYYERILQCFELDAKLGIASGIYENLIDGELHAVLSDRRATPKAIMVFRREAFEEIGGFLPLPYGGEDTAACIMGRMRGWKTWSFPDVRAVHHRPTGMGNAKNVLRARYVQGLHEYGLGSHPLFVLGKSMRRMLAERPFVAGGIMRLLGYLAGTARGKVREMPDEAVQFYRREQMHRILRWNTVPKDLRPGDTKDVDIGQQTRGMP